MFKNVLVVFSLLGIFSLLMAANVSLSHDVGGRAPDESYDSEDGCYHYHIFWNSDGELRAKVRWDRSRVLWPQPLESSVCSNTTGVESVDEVNPPSVVPDDNGGNQNPENVIHTTNNNEVNPPSVVPDDNGGNQNPENVIHTTNNEVQIQNDIVPPTPTISIAGVPDNSEISENRNDNIFNNGNNDIIGLSYLCNADIAKKDILQITSITQKNRPNRLIVTLRNNTKEKLGRGIFVPINSKEWRVALVNGDRIKKISRTYRGVENILLITFQKEKGEKYADTPVTFTAKHNFKKIDWDLDRSEFGNSLRSAIDFNYSLGSGAVGYNKDEDSLVFLYDCNQDGKFVINGELNPDKIVASWPERVTAAPSIPVSLKKRSITTTWGAIKSK